MAPTPWALALIVGSVDIQAKIARRFEMSGGFGGGAAAFQD
jgi:hypothetical protein